MDTTIIRSTSTPIAREYDSHDAAQALAHAAATAVNWTWDLLLSEPTYRDSETAFADLQKEIGQ